MTLMWCTRSVIRVAKGFSRIICRFDIRKMGSLKR